MSTSTIPDRATLVKRGRKLEYLTIGWNAVEGAVAVWAGIIAGSISLIAFGADSLIELASAAALLWRMSVDANIEQRERNEKHALRIVGICFLSLAEIRGSVLAVSQFTLYGDVRKGRRPSFDQAAPPAVANELYEYFVRKIREAGFGCESGRFQEMMKVELVNDGPVTILLDSAKAF